MCESSPLTFTVTMWEISQPRQVAHHHAEAESLPPEFMIATRTIDAMLNGF